MVEWSIFLCYNYEHKNHILCAQEDCVCVFFLNAMYFNNAKYQQEVRFLFMQAFLLASLLGDCVLNGFQIFGSIIPVVVQSDD